METVQKTEMRVHLRFLYFMRLYIVLGAVDCAVLRKSVGVACLQLLDIPCKNFLKGDIKGGCRLGKIPRDVAELFFYFLY